LCHRPFKFVVRGMPGWGSADTSLSEVDAGCGCGRGGYGRTPVEADP
jgi:hypothetical protein